MTSDQIQAQLSRILGSTWFDQADRAKAFLSFVVTTALDGRANQIKESVIAVEALARSTSFDPKADPIVRVEAGRLRGRLKSYYDSEGRHDSILITLPKAAMFLNSPNGAMQKKLPHDRKYGLPLWFWEEGCWAGLSWPL